MKILVVDDEKLARARMRELIEKEGEHTIIGEAMNGNEAIEKTMSLKPECLLMDIRMPVMDGLEAAMHLQSLEAPHPPSTFRLPKADGYFLSRRPDPLQFLHCRGALAEPLLRQQCPGR